jgi:hypothetical protein
MRACPTMLAQSLGVTSSNGQNLHSFRHRNVMFWETDALRPLISNTQSGHFVYNSNLTFWRKKKYNYKCTEHYDKDENRQALSSIILQSTFLLLFLRKGTLITLLHSHCPTKNRCCFSTMALVLTLWRRSSSKCYLRIQSVPQREQHTSPLQRSTG